VLGPTVRVTRFNYESTTLGDGKAGDAIYAEPCYGCLLSMEDNKYCSKDVRVPRH
jgi:hypothetical protein